MRAMRTPVNAPQIDRYEEARNRSFETGEQIVFACLHSRLIPAPRSVGGSPLRRTAPASHAAFRAARGSDVEGQRSEHRVDRREVFSLMFCNPPPTSRPFDLSTQC